MTVTREHLAGLELALQQWNKGGPSAHFATQLSDLVAQAKAAPVEPMTGTEQVSSTWLAQLREEYLTFGSECQRLTAENARLRQHKTEYMEAAEETRRALADRLAEFEATRCPKCESDVAIETRRNDSAEAVELQRILFARHMGARPDGAGLMGWAAVVLAEIEARQGEQKPAGYGRPQTCNGRSCGWCKEGAEPCHYASPPPAPDVAGLVEALRELISAVRSINCTKRHQITIKGDDDPCYWQRHEWISWVIGLCAQADAALSAHAQLNGVSDD